MKKKGFTLIELLAVIVVLAIIALIATPIILGVIDTAKKGSAESSALGYIDAVEKYMVISQIDDTKVKLVPGTYQVSDETELSLIDYVIPKVYAKEDSEIYLNDVVSVKGDKPTKGIVIIGDNKVENYSLVTEEYVVTKDKETKKGNTPDEISSGSTAVVSGPTMIAALAGQTHKGIIYLDPTNLTKTCNAENSVSTTETKTGCMKWYVFNDTGDTYTMILDHNTTARIKWNDANSNVAYESSNLKAVVDDLVTTSNWQVTPRLITADEVNTITGKIGFDSTNPGSWYYFDTNPKSQIRPTFTTTRSEYDWLYNNLNKCNSDSIDYGCTVEDLNTYIGYGTAGNGNTWGYWTNTYSSSLSSSVWNINDEGNLFAHTANNPNLGIRPVITISKSNIS